MPKLNHQQRFDRWRRLASKPTKHLIEQVLECIVPAFQANGFVWQLDYAGGDPNEIGANTIPLQVRSGSVWPTVEIRISRLNHPCFTIYFAALPSECRRLGEPIPREKALVLNAPVYFTLCKGRGRGLDSQFGYRWFSLYPVRKLNREVAIATSLLPEVFRLFEDGIPNAWLVERGYVSKHIRVGGSWHLFEELRTRRHAAQQAAEADGRGR
jgi:hypothetical protein